MKWLIVGIYFFSLLWMHLRGKVRLPLRQQLLDGTTLIAPINLFMLLFSRTPVTPFIADGKLPELARLREHWESIRAEAEGLRARGANGLYLKWCDSIPSSARVLCPRTCALLQAIPAVRLAVFAELPPGASLRRHRDPYAGWLRYHLGLATPNHEACFIEVDGERYAWRDGEAMLFDDTYVHSLDNGCGSGRLVLVCDVERPMRFRWAQSVNHLFGRMLTAAVNPPEAIAGGTGLAAMLLRLPRGLSRWRRRLRAWNMAAYKATVAVAVAALAVLLVAL